MIIITNRPTREHAVMAACILILAIVLAGCGTFPLSEAVGEAHKVNGNTIDASMSDQKILQAFGIDINIAERKKANGPDGYQITYTRGEQSVTILRSRVTGMYVHSSGPIKGEWRLAQSQGTPY
ncbi:MAG: hypothetical protein WBD22_08810 [Pyrinomonadaceae bacterium]